MTKQSDPATDHMLCMAVGCESIAEHTVLAIVVVKDKEEKHKINFCRDHYLKQMAYQYAKEESK